MPCSVLIKDSDLLDTVAGCIVSNTQILIENGCIKHVSSEPLAEDSVDTIIDGKGCTVIPGLINMHSHPQRRHARCMGPDVPFRQGAAAVEDLPNTQRILWAVKNCWTELLEDGVTTIRAAGSKDHLNIELRNAFEEGIFHGPRVVSTGAIIATTGGHATRGLNGAMEADGVDEVRKAVRSNLKAGADWIKLCVSGGLCGIHKGDHPSIVEFSEEEIATAVIETHQRERKVMVHGMAAESVKRAVRCGVDCIEHGVRIDDEAITMMREANTFFVPTMSGIRVVYEREHNAGNTEVAQMLYEAIKPHKEVVSKCFEQGILIGAGTDTLGYMPREIELLHDCGISRIDAIRAATINAAKILGLEDEIGSVEAGKKADLVILEGNPAEDLAALSKISHVIMAGEVYTRDYLNIFNHTLKGSFT